jgi:hypothetical protein
MYVLNKKGFMVIEKELKSNPPMSMAILHFNFSFYLKKLKIES